MTDQKSTTPNPQDPGFLANLWRDVQLAWRLLRDPEVSAFVKIIPLATIAYWLFPFEGAANMLLVTPVDDVTLFFIGLKTFIQMAPPHVVSKHRMALAGGVVEGEWEPVDAKVDPSKKEVEEQIVLNPDK